MPPIDIDKLLSDISPEAPCGPDLEYDAEFIALMEDAKGKPAKYTLDGKLVGEAEEPNWRDVRNRCEALFGRTIDLRIGMLMVRALMSQDGLPGLRNGLALIKGMFERHWDSLHPQLDPEDGNDPLMRMNLLASLAAPIGQDGDLLRFQQHLREIPLASSAQLGRFSLRDLLIAAGEISPPSGTAPVQEGLLDAAFRDTDAEALKEAGKAAEACVSLSKEIDQWVTAKVGATKACNLGNWHTLVADLNKRLSARVQARFPGDSVAEEPTAEQAAADGEQPAAGGAARAAGAALTGHIHTRDDVLRALNKVLEYYARSEPSSPVPMLIRRAQRLVNADFLEIMRELSPNALDQLRVISGEDANSPRPPVAIPPDPRPTPAPQKSNPPAPAAPPPPAASGKDFEPVKLGKEMWR